MFGVKIFEDTYYPLSNYASAAEQIAAYNFDKGWIVSFFLLGCFFGSFINGYLSDKVGRKWTVIIGSIVFVIGGAVQTAFVNIPMLYIGRLIAGLAVGGLSVSDVDSCALMQAQY